MRVTLPRSLARVQVHWSVLSCEATSALRAITGISPDLITEIPHL
jgi:hypothetical protein